MSTNFHIKAKRSIYIPSINWAEFQYKILHVWQTPSEVTRKLIEANDPLEAYFDYMRSRAVVLYYEYSPSMGFEYDWDGFSMIMDCEVSKHILILKKEIKNLQKEGYEMVYEAW